MKDKHILIRAKQCLEIAKASNCIRKQAGALIIDPIRNVILIDAYNGAARGGSELCGENCCLREEMKIPSGTQTQIGCIHAECNAISNSSFNGIKTEGSWMFVSMQPCLMCAKIIHQSGIKKVFIVNTEYSTDEGAEYLLKHDVQVEYLNLELK